LPGGRVLITGIWDPQLKLDLVSVGGIGYHPLTLTGMKATKNQCTRANNVSPVQTTNKYDAQ